jgi:tRNA 2-thiocytidine biosynthesis protein TtcA
MPARLAATGEGRGMALIRPLVYVPEELLAAYAAERSFPLVICGCPTCGTSLQKRQWVKQLLRRLDSEVPGLKESMITALKGAGAGHLLSPVEAPPEGLEEELAAVLAV